MKDDEDFLLSKLADKAKKKLNKQQKTEKQEKKERKGTYEFVKSTRKDTLKKLEKKIAQILKNSPDCDDPIGKLIDHSVYDLLSEEKKQLYILQLSKSYQEIHSKLAERTI